MSSFNIDLPKDKFCTIGFDYPMLTFFFQSAKCDSEDIPILWLGTKREQFTALSEIERHIGEHYELEGFHIEPGLRKELFQSAQKEIYARFLDKSIERSEMMRLQEHITD